MGQRVIANAWTRTVILQDSSKPAAPTNRFDVTITAGQARFVMGGTRPAVAIPLPTAIISMMRLVSIGSLGGTLVIASAKMGRVSISRAITIPSTARRCAVNRERRICEVPGNNPAWFIRASPSWVYLRKKNKS